MARKSILTTTLGSFPRPDYVPVLTWLQARMKTGEPAKNYKYTKESEGLFVRGTQEVIRAQVDAGIDVPTDGEIRRESYVYYHCRQLSGIDFDNLTRKKGMRGGSWEDMVPVITGKIKPKRRFLPKEWRIAQSFTVRPLKITLPGPMTIADYLFDNYYGDEHRLCADLADALNLEIRALARAGCIWIQVDEPVFVREPQKTLAYGIDTLERCFYGVPKGVNRVVHVCCGSPTKLDMDDYPKADPNAYFFLADALESLSIDAVSIEDAHRHNDLSLLEHFIKTKVILGVLDIAKTRVESQDEIAARLRDALDHIDFDRLIAAPDCGLGMLDKETAVAKLKNMTAAAKQIGS